MQDHPRPVSLAAYDTGGIAKRRLTILQRELSEVHLSQRSQADSSEAQTVSLARYRCKWVQFVALTAISLECIWSLHHEWSSSTHQVSFRGCEIRGRIVHHCSFSWGRRGREDTSASRRAINCKGKKRSDTWTDGFSILLSLPVHLHLVRGGKGEREEVAWNDLCQCIRANCSFTWTHKWGPVAWAVSGQLGIPCFEVRSIPDSDLSWMLKMWNSAPAGEAQGNRYYNWY